MLLIFSLDYDNSTNEVVRWLNYFRHPFIRLNNLNDLNRTKLEITQETHKFELNGIDIDRITSVWFRRTPEYIPEKFQDNVVEQQFNEVLHNEYRSIYSHLVEQLKDRFWLSHPGNSSLNKLNVLASAKKVGLLIPPTYLLNNKKELHTRVEEDELIVKPIYEVPRIWKNNKAWVTRTSEVLIDTEVPEDFVVSKFQKKIEKEFEIRSVFLLGNFYSMSIHSQENDKTRLDFRNYDNDFPNRYCPIRMPEEIEDKLRQLLLMFHLNFASIDLILDRTGNYYFLEINPVGQFGMTSGPNNYNLERKIAEFLITKSNDFNSR